MDPALRQEIKGGDCFAEMADINLVDQTVVEKLKVGGFRTERRRWREFGGSGKREAEARHIISNGQV